MKIVRCCFNVYVKFGGRMWYETLEVSLYVLERFYKHILPCIYNDKSSLNIYLHVFHKVRRIAFHKHGESNAHESLY